MIQIGCRIPKVKNREANLILPDRYQQKDSQNVADKNWQFFYQDSLLKSYIDTALKNNQELNVVIQEIEISKNEVRARKSEYLPKVGFGLSSGLEHPGRYTQMGALEDQLLIKPGQSFPDPMRDYMLGAKASWEVDLWKRLRNARKAAALRYLATIEGKNFMVTQIVGEIAQSYYELMALDNLLEIIELNIQIQESALQVVSLQKQAAKVTQLAVNRFEAQLLNTQNLRFQIRQKIIESENRIRFLTGKSEGKILRNSSAFILMPIDSMYYGLPSHLLHKRPDIRQAELELAAAKLDVYSARARFMPTFEIRANLGYQAFNPTYLVKPESVIYSLSGDLLAPLINRNAIKASYNTANAKQIQSVYQYEKTVLSAYLDVVNQMNKLQNFTQSLSIKTKEVDILMQSIGIAGNLFNSARADYAEVLLTQREALDAKIELIETKMNQLSARVNLYRALGGGW